MMNFLNTNRDYSCTVQQFLRLFRDNFAIEEGDLADWQIRVLMQRYAGPVPKADRDKKGDKKVNNISNTQSKASAAQKIFYFPMIQDFGNRHNGI